jgi:hypothetical protein
MAKPHDHINPEHRAFIEAQQMFFVATAPLAPGGRVNISPKGLDTLRVLDDRRVAYLDLTGSGNETSAHLEESGRITFMFCALEGPPKILRLYGTGGTVLAGTPEWDELAPRFELLPGARQIILAEIDRVQTSCGYGVPLYAFQKQREELPAWAERKGADGLERYHHDRNAASIDGLPTTLGKSLS